MLAVALVMAVVVAFGPALRAPFIFDDLESIAGNVTIRRLWPITVPLSPPADVATSGRPVTNLSFALNYAANAAAGIDEAPGSADPNQTTGYHLANLLLHLLAGALLFGIVRRTMLGPRVEDTWRRLADPVAGAVAAIWLLHPLQTEAVLYLTQRTELLVSACYLGTLYGAIRAWDTPDPVRRKRWYAFAVAACLAGMGSKEFMISAPLMVLLYERAFRFDSWRETLAVRGERRAFHVALWATTLWLLWFILMGARAETVGFGLGIPWYRYLYTQAWAVSHYLRLAVWPVGLVLDYGRDPVTGFAGVPGAVLLVAAGVATLVAWRRSPPLAFVGSWFFLLLAPSSSIVPIRTEMAAERRVYLAFAAVVLIAVMGIVALARRRTAGAGQRTMASAGLGAVCLALAAGTYQRALALDPRYELARQELAELDNMRGR